MALSITTEKEYNNLLFPLHGFGSIGKKKVKTLKTSMFIVLNERKVVNGAAALLGVDRCKH